MMYQEVAGGICAPKGFTAAGVHCGIRANHNEKYDLALIKAEVRCAAAGVYTTNKVCGAPIKVDRAHLKDGYAQAILVNSGNANTCAANGVALAIMAIYPLFTAPMGNMIIENFNVSIAFNIVGVFCIVGFIVLSRFLKMPAADFKPEGWNPPAESDTSA